MASTVEDPGAGVAARGRPGGRGLGHRPCASTPTAGSVSAGRVEAAGSVSAGRVEAIFIAPQAGAPTRADQDAGALAGWS
jgi:hypothetical protein